MQTIRLSVNKKVYKNLMWFLNKFSQDELQVIEEDDAFLSVQKELKSELHQIETGNGDFVALNHLENELEATIRKHED